MAKFYSSTFGAISGKHGSAVAVTRKDGTTYIRIYTKPSNPRTDKQQAHRAKFALSSKALVPFNPIFKETIGITNGISAARSYAFKNAIVGEYPNFSVDYESLMFSFGPLEKLHNASATCNGDVVTINWDFQKMYNCHADDSANLVVFNKECNQALHIKDVALRKERLSNIIIQDSWADSELYFWAYVTSGDKISDSVFVGKCRPSDVVSDSYNETGKCYEDAYSFMNELDVKVNEPKYDYSSDRLSANAFIMRFIMMLCNLLSLFKQAVVGDNIQDFVKVLRYRYYSMVERVENIDNEREFNARLGRSWGGVFEEMCVKYQHIFNTLLMSRNTILNV